MFAAIIPVAPATAAAINPALVGPMVVLQAFGVSSTGAQRRSTWPPSDGRRGGGLAYTVIARTRLDRSVGAVEAEAYVPIHRGRDGRVSGEISRGRMQR